MGSPDSSVPLLWIGSPDIFDRCSTIVSGSGTVLHEGQLFFNETENTRVLASDAYLNTTQERLVNDDDSILQSIIGSGFSPFVDIDFLGDDVDAGA